MENSSQSIFYQNISGAQTEGKLINLDPFKTYAASVSAFTKAGNGNQFSNTIQFTTQESAPDSVQNMRCVATSWQSILVQWDPPARPNGKIIQYVLKFQNLATFVLETDNA
ncbi:unnamed protein product, partial [Staurois parvus]